MADVYADSSALVKRHIPEGGSIWFQALVDPVAGNVITTPRRSPMAGGGGVAYHNALATAG